ncbi:hypothetical protein E4T50_02702 [Aureobasidium sp. EXF-12298]|nr:hypothetical protein E4T50_02702 [Aureobasidium sp. EXF-12298]
MAAISAISDPQLYLANRLHLLHESGAYSDLTIVCGSHTYNVHKAIICPQSSFFRAACQPGRFQEGTTNVINITASSGRNKPVEQVKPVEPTEPIQPTESTEPTESDVMPEFDWDLDVETTASVKLMIHYFYHHDYLEKETAQTDGVTVHEALLDEHARMYAMGEKYGVLGLKSVALIKFCGEHNRLITEERAVTATVIAFNAVPSSDKTFRRAVLRFLYHGRHFFRDNVAIQKMILSMPEVSYGLYRLSIDYEPL